MKIHVVKSEVLDAASGLQRALDDFIEASNTCKQAADHLASNWKGDRQVDFAREQENNQRIFQQMSRSVSNFIAALKKAEDSYGDVDAECARLLKSK